MRRESGDKTTGTRELVKDPSGIKGPEVITGGGPPMGRPSLISGGPGCGKTLFAMEFIIRGITDYNESGVFIGKDA
jgi:circadian clock protein KaiC